eukprot:m.194813 g.194813  ORF g.194813 m.194813 type:complete len:276 (+) comp15683_c0_seq4:651-1478(+)
MEGIYAKCSNIEPNRVVNGILRPERTVKWFKEKHKELVSVGMQLMKKYNASGEHDDSDRYDCYAEFLDKGPSRKVEIWYLFGCLDHEELKKLGKVIDPDDQVVEISSDDDEASVYTKKTKMLSDNASAKRKREYRTRKKELMMETKEQNRLLSENNRLTAKVTELQQEEVVVKKLRITSEEEIKKLQIKTEDERELLKIEREEEVKRLQIANDKLKIQNDALLGAAKIFLEHQKSLPGPVVGQVWQRLKGLMGIIENDDDNALSDAGSLKVSSRK